jgi:hypothetical protein
VIRRQAGRLTANKIKCKNKRPPSHNNNHGRGGFSLNIQKMLRILAVAGIAVLAGPHERALAVSPINPTEGDKIEDSISQNLDAIF